MKAVRAFVLLSKILLQRCGTLDNIVNLVTFRLKLKNRFFGVVETVFLSNDCVKLLQHQLCATIVSI